MSFRSKIDKRRQTYVRLLGEIAHALNKALEEEHAQRGLTQADIARMLGKQKSFVSRKLSGDTNMTLETLADLAYALDRPVRVSLPSRRPEHGRNYSNYISREEKTARQELLPQIERLGRHPTNIRPKTYADGHQHA